MTGVLNSAGRPRARCLPMPGRGRPAAPARHSAWGANRAISNADPKQCDSSRSLVTILLNLHGRGVALRLPAARRDAGPRQMRRHCALTRPWHDRRPSRAAALPALPDVARPRNVTRGDRCEETGEIHDSILRARPEQVVLDRG